MAADEDLVCTLLERGLKPGKSLNFVDQGQLAVISGDTLTVYHTTNKTDNYVILYPLKSTQSQKTSKHTILAPIVKLLYINDAMLYIAFSNDFRLRVLDRNFELLISHPVPYTVGSLCYNEETCELYAGGLGFIHSWTLQLHGFNSLIPNSPLQCSLHDKERIIHLSLCHHAPLLCVTCTNGIYLVDTDTRRQQYHTNVHDTALKCATVYSPLNYIIMATENGSIKVSSYTTTKTKLLFTHSLEVTSLFVHPDLPYLVSSSLDGTIRMWHLMTLTQCHMYNIQKPVLSVLITPHKELICFSQWGYKSLSLYPIEELVSVLHSEVVKLSIANNEQKQRIVALTSNGCVRLISPHSGKCLTVLFSIISTKMLQGIFHNVTEEALYISLRTGEIMVFTTKTNPCTPIELWAPSNSKQEVTCIDMVESVVGPMLIAGLRSGCLSILHAKDCLIGQPCPAHDGAVVSLASSISHQQIRKNPIVRVISYGSDGLIQVWAIEIKMDINQQLVIHNITSLNLHLWPLHIKMIDSTFCITTGTRQVFIYELPPGTTNNFRLITLHPITHNPADRHYGAITSLSCCYTLRLFATSSRDGCVKVWNDRCQLVSNIKLGSCISSICFNNLSYDLFVGFQNQLYIIPVRRYLHSSFYRSHKVTDTMVEYPLQFQSGLKFWYDCTKVPTLPLLPHAREHAADYIPAPNPFTLRLISQPQYDTKMLSSGDKIDSMDSHPSIAPPRNIRQLGIVDPEQVLKPSISVMKHQFSLKELHTPSYDDSEHLLPGNIQANVSDDTLFENYSFEDSLPQIAKEPSHFQLFPEASLTPITKRSSSDRHPIAPDGFIPNSVIRAKMVHQSTDKVLQRILLRQYKVLENQKNTWAKRKRIKKVLIDLKLMDADSDLSRPATAAVMSTKSGSGKGTTDEDSSTASTTEDEEEDNLSIDQDQDKYYIDLPTQSPAKTPPRPRSRPSTNFIPLPPETQVDHLPPLRTLTCNFKIDIADEDEQSDATPTNKRRDTHFSGSRQTPDDNSADSSLHGSKRAPFSPNSRGFKIKVPFQPKPYTVNPSSKLELLNDEDHVPSGKTQSEIFYRSRFQSSITNSTSTPNMSQPYTAIKSNKLDDLRSALAVIYESTSSSRLSHDFNETLAWVVETLVDLVDNSDASVFDEIAQALATLNIKNFITNSQKGSAVRALLNKYHDSGTNDITRKHIIELVSLLQLEGGTGGDNTENFSAATVLMEMYQKATESATHQSSTTTKENILQFISELGYSDESLMMILPTLVDANAKVRQAGFKALKRLTGVTTRNGLHKLLVERRLLKYVDMNEDEILQELAEKMQRERQHVSSRWHSLGRTKPSLLSRGDHSLSNKELIAETQPIYHQHYYNIPTNSDTVPDHVTGESGHMMTGEEMDSGCQMSPTVTFPGRITGTAGRRTAASRRAVSRHISSIPGHVTSPTAGHMMQGKHMISAENKPRGRAISGTATPCQYPYQHTTADDHREIIDEMVTNHMTTTVDHMTTTISHMDGDVSRTTPTHKVLAAFQTTTSRQPTEEATAGHMIWDMGHMTPNIIPYVAGHMTQGGHSLAPVGYDVNTIPHMTAGHMTHDSNLYTGHMTGNTDTFMGHMTQASHIPSTAGDRQTGNTISLMAGHMTHATQKSNQNYTGRMTELAGHMTQDQSQRKDQANDPTALIIDYRVDHMTTPTGHVTVSPINADDIDHMIVTGQGAANVDYPQRTAYSKMGFTPARETPSFLTSSHGYTPKSIVFSPLILQPQQLLSAANLFQSIPQYSQSVIVQEEAKNLHQKKQRERRRFQAKMVKLANNWEVFIWSNIHPLIHEKQLVAKNSALSDPIKLPSIV